MTVHETAANDGAATAAPSRRTLLLRLSVSAIVAGIAIWILAVSTRGIDSERVRNPNPKGTVWYDGVPRAHEPLWGFEYWPYLWEIVCVVVALGFWAYFIAKSVQQRRAAPGLIAMVASTLCLVWDPIVNWSAFDVFDPRFLHYPIDWPYINITPNVACIFVYAGYPFYLIIPGVIAIALDKRFVEPRLSSTSWIARHFLIRLFSIGFVMAVIFDFSAELLMVRTEVWQFVQAPGPIIHIGPHQFPVLWEPALFSPTMAVTAMMLHRDDTGRTMMHRVAERISWLRSRRFWGPVLVALVIYTIPYMGIYTAGFSIFRLTGYSNNLEQPFPFQEMKVYDPQGRFENAGEPGPYYEGTWSGPRFEPESSQSGG